MKNAHKKSPHWKLCNSLKNQMGFCFLVATFFWFTLEKKDVLSFFSRRNTKKLTTKKLKLPSESLENFTFCHAAVFKLRQVSLFFY